MNDKSHRRKLLRNLVVQGHRLACCAVTVAEVYSGMRLHEEPETDQFLCSRVWYEASRDIARRAGRLRFDWARQGTTLSLADALIAATVIEHGLTLITSNPKRFPTRELALYIPYQKEAKWSP